MTKQPIGGRAAMPEGRGGFCVG